MTRPEGISESAWEAAGELIPPTIRFMREINVAVDALQANIARAIQAAQEAERAKADEALKELDAYLAQIGGCGDGHCIVMKPKGMHTNGGCRCYNDGYKMARYAYAVNRFIEAIRKGA